MIFESRQGPHKTHAERAKSAVPERTLSLLFFDFSTAKTMRDGVKSRIGAEDKIWCFLSVSLQYEGASISSSTPTNRNLDPGNLSTDAGSAHTRTAVLLIAHGSRRAEANYDLVHLAELVAARGEYDMVEVSYLELTTPTILDGGRRCVERGANQVLMLPYFLSAGVHVVNDLEEIRTQLTAEFPEIAFVLCPHLGLHPLMADSVLSRLKEGLSR